MGRRTMRRPWERVPTAGKVAAVVLLVAIGAGVYWYVNRDVASPSADDIAAAIASRVPDVCPGEITTRSVDDIGGPGLPGGMKDAEVVECHGSGRRDGPLAVAYLFASADAAKRWLAQNDFHLDDTAYGWWLNGRTLTGSGPRLQHRDWLRVRAALERRS